MHDPLVVRRCEPASDLRSQVLRGHEIEAAARHPFAQVLTLDQLHRNEDAALGLPDLVDGGDVGVRDGGRRAGFPQESLPALLAAARVGQELQRDGSPKRLVFGAVHHTHSAAPQGASDAEVCDP